MSKIQVPLLDLAKQHQSIQTEIEAAIHKTIESQRFILGTEVELLESEIASYVGCQYGVGVSSGSDALLMALMVLDLKPGDEVITAPYTFFATVGAISRLGLRPVFVDIDPKSFNLDANQIESKITQKTKAIIPVHLFGQSANMDPILSLAKSKGIHIIEDAAQAIGTKYQGKSCGSMGTMGCFSFFPSKNLGAMGDGGMVTTQTKELAEKLSVYRSHGSKPKYYHQYVGGNFRLDAIQAAVLRIKLKYLDDWTKARQQNAARYDKLFSNSAIDDFLTVPWKREGDRHIYNQYNLRVKNRDELKSYLANEGIQTEIYYPMPMHLQACFSSLGYKKGDFPESEAAAQESLAIPNFPELTSTQQQFVADRIMHFYRK